MTFVQALLVAVLACCTSGAVAQNIGDECRTPNRTPGVCVGINECPPLLAILQSHPTQQQLAVLNRSNCGFAGNNPIVCCPRTSTVSSSPPTSSPSTSTSVMGEPQAARDVSKHPNLRLLPSGKCGPSGGDRIFGGKETEINEYPWMVRLGYSSPRSGATVSWKCGGSLVNENYVLTAAHCVLTSGFQLKKIRVGEHNMATNPDCSVKEKFCNDPFIDFDVEQALAHPKYNKVLLKNDIAIVRLRGRVNIAKDLRPVCLPVGIQLQNRNFDNETMVVAGWGTTEKGSDSQVLLKVEVPVVMLESCKRTYQAETKLGPSQMCAGGKQGHDSCTGDSGGPLMLSDTGKSVQFGVVSFGPKLCGSENKPGVYTRVGYYMDWILDNMKP